MDAKQLKTLQAPIKESYKRDPSKAMLTLKAEGKLGEGVTCSLKNGKALLEAGLHPKTGGDGRSVCSGDMLLEALVACAGVTLSAVATAIDVPIDDGKVIAEGDLDFRGTLGVDENAPVGFKNIRLTFNLKTDAPEEKLEALTKLTERYCVVYQTLKQPLEIQTKIYRE